VFKTGARWKRGSSEDILIHASKMELLYRVKVNHCQRKSCLQMLIYHKNHMQNHHLVQKCLDHATN